MAIAIFRVSSSLPIAWARLYTLGLSSEERDARLTKVMSDVHEQRSALEEENGSGVMAAVEVLVCLVGSVSADLTWRVARGRAQRLGAVHAGHHPFPTVPIVMLAVATLAAAFRLSVEHDLSSREHLVLLVGLIVGPLLAIVGLYLAPLNPVSAVLAISAGLGALAAATWPTVVGPVAVGLGGASSALFVLETWPASETMDGDRNGATQAGEPEDWPPEEEGFVMPSTLERWLSLGGILFAAGFILVVVASFGDKNPENTDEEILAYFAEGHSTAAYLGFLGAAFGGLGLLAFFGGMYGSLRRAERGTGLLSTISIAGAAIFITMWFLQAAMANVMVIAYAYEDNFKAAGVDPQTVRTLSVLGYLLLTMGAMGAAAAVGSAAAIALRSGEVLNKWFAWSGIALALLLLASFPLFAMPVAFFAVWVFVVGLWRLVRGTSFAAESMRARTEPRAGTA